MKKILTTILFCFSISFLFAQNINLYWYVGTWKYENSANGEELIIKLKKTQKLIPLAIGEGTEECLVGVYSYKKNNQILVNKLDLFNKELEPYACPITLTTSNSPSKLMLNIKDYIISNGRGEYKSIGVPSTISYNSSSPKAINWMLEVVEQENFYYEQIDRFPEGTNLPKNIILSKVE